jgi:undecaprenyl-diphosphatase
MNSSTLVLAAFLGLVEGLTEFIPVSSTGHLILLVDLVGFRGPPGKVFEIAIQLGAILAVCWVYRTKLIEMIVKLPVDQRARHFSAAVLLAFLPAALIGAVAHDFIKSVLFSPWVVSVSLILGGLAIIGIERAVPVPRMHDVDDIGLATAFKIGLFQTLAMIPGVSRSGATIMGALLLRVDRPAAAEFSFFLAIPTMTGATVYDLWKNRLTLDFGNDGLLIGIGFVAAFLAALVVVRKVVDFVSTHGFAPFGWYRILLGTCMLVWLTFAGTS